MDEGDRGNGRGLYYTDLAFHQLIRGFDAFWGEDMGRRKKGRGP